jgi:hypothetical protein
MLVTLNEQTPLTNRYYFTMWFENATGYSDQFLNEVKTALQKSNFPQINFQDVHVKSGGCLGRFGAEEFDAVHIESDQEDLKDIGCIYKSSEFGNLVHLSLLFYQKQRRGFFENLKAAIKALFSIFKKSNSIKEAEYQEVFYRLLHMSISEAASKLGSDPLQVEFDPRDSSKSSASGLSGLMSKFKG